MKLEGIVEGMEGLREVRGGGEGNTSMALSCSNSSPPVGNVGGIVSPGGEMRGIRGVDSVGVEGGVGGWRGNGKWWRVIYYDLRHLA